MPRISVLLPTHEHASTLPYAVRSVQQQGVDDIEILICGDGVTEEVRSVVAELVRSDGRIRFFDLPKGPARGELNRHYVMSQAQGRLVFHQNDDDLWLPGHVEVLEHALEDADFVGAIQVNVDTDGKARAHYFDLERPEFVDPWLQWIPNAFGEWACDGFGPIFVAHRLDAYRRLPEGWATTPPGLPADQVMWHKFLRQPWCRARFLRWPIALHFPAPDRVSWSPAERGEELRRWTQIVESPDCAARIWRDIMPDLGDRLLRQSLRERQQRAEMQAAQHAAAGRETELRAQLGSLELQLEETRALSQASKAALEHELAATKAALEHQLAATRAALEQELAASKAAFAHELAANSAAFEQELAVARTATAHEQSLRASAESERDALRSSTSWRITAPLRLLAERVRKIRRR